MIRQVSSRRDETLRLKSGLLYASGGGDSSVMMITSRETLMLVGEDLVQCLFVYKERHMKDETAARSQRVTA